MITKELIERINELSRKQKSSNLTKDEQSEQQQLRRIYIDCIKERVKETLKDVEFTDEPLSANSTRRRPGKQEH